jgi:hypothetical protein
MLPMRVLAPILDVPSEQKLGLRNESLPAANARENPRKST